MSKTLMFVLFFLAACAIVRPHLGTPPPAPSSIQTIQNIADNSACSKINWKNRGHAPQAYAEGVAVTFAKAVCHPTRPDVQLVSSARFQPESQYDRTDSLSWYHSNFENLGMSNDQAGLDTLRHVYTLLVGLGMRESSGQYCCGRDTSANFTSADSAEAGTFQASWGAHRSSLTILTNMFNAYQASNAGCYLNVWSHGVRCSATDAINWGTGTGHDWQAITKECPSFAAEYAAVLLRTSGGTKGEFGPLRRKEAEIRPECDQMLRAVQDLVTQNPAYCQLL